MSETLIHDPGNKASLDVVYAYVSVDKDGNEGLCGALTDSLGAIPMITGSKKVAEGHFRTVAKMLARETGKTIVMHEFHKAGAKWRCSADKPEGEDIR